MVFESPGATHARMFLRTITPAAVLIESDLPDGQGAEVVMAERRAKARERRYTQAFRERHYDFLRRYVELKTKIERAIHDGPG